MRGEGGIKGGGWEYEIKHTQKISSCKLKVRLMSARDEI